LKADAWSLAETRPGVMPAQPEKVGGGGTAMRDGRTALTMPISIEDGESFS
jgi:hypothetical protein